jgi:hypothetical protein
MSSSEDIVRHRVLRKGQFILETRELEMIADLQIRHKIEKGAGFRRPLLVRMAVSPWSLLAAELCLCRLGHTRQCS